MIFQYNRNRTYEFDISIFELTRAYKASYSLFINLLFKDFDYIIRKVSHNLKMEDLSNKRSYLIEISEDI